jgi:hypothetical protein
VILPLPENVIIINAHLHGITVERLTVTISGNTLVRNHAQIEKIGSTGLWTPSIRVGDKVATSASPENIVLKIITRNPACVGR